MIWTEIAYFIITVVISIALSPKPTKPKAAALEDFEFPTAEEGRAIPVVFGVVKISGPNVIWYGDLDVKAIKKRSGFSKATVGYKYSIGFHLALCHGPVNGFTQIRWDDKLVWIGNQNTNGSISIDNGKLFGGKNRGGGVKGTFNVMMGAADQGVNAYLVSQLGAAMPAFRGVTGLVWTGGYIGNSEYVKAVSVVVWRTTAGWSGEAWYPEKAGTGAGMNPAHIIYQCLTDPKWGMGVSPNFINDANFRSVADQLFDEEFGLSMLWNQSTPIEQFLQLVIERIDGGLTLNLTTGLYELTLFRANYDPEDLNTYDSSDIITFTKFEKQAWGETVNEITLTYTDEETFKSTAITAQDLGNIDAQGTRLAATIDFSGIRTESLARTVIARELAKRTTPLTHTAFTVNRRAWSLGFGALFRLNRPERQCVGRVFRVLKIDRGTLQDNTITVEAIEDIYQNELGVGLIVEPTFPTEVPPDVGDEDDAPEGSNVISTTTTAPPGSPADGDLYYVPVGATGAWAGEDGQLAEWNAELSEWEFYLIPEGEIFYVNDTQTTVQFDGTTVAPFAGGASLTVVDDDTDPPLEIENVERLVFENAELTQDTDGTARVTLGKTISQVVSGFGLYSSDTPPYLWQPPDDEFEYATSVDLTGARRSLSQAWTWRNQDASTGAVGGGNLILLCPADAGRELHGVEQPTFEDSSGAFKYRIKLAVHHADGATQMGGAYVGVNGSGKLLSLSWGYASGGLTLQADRWTSATAHDSAQGASTAVDEKFDAHDWLYVEVEYDGADVIFRYSKTGADATFKTFYTEAHATFLGAAPDRVGVWGASSNSGQPTVVLCDWFRQVPDGGFEYPPSAVQMRTQTMREVVLALNPDFYAPADDGVNGFKDLSGNNWDTGDVGDVQHTYSVLVPSDPNARYAYFPSGTTYSYHRLDPSEVVRPVTRDWSAIAVVCPLVADATQWIFSLAGSGETSAVNYQAAIFLSGSGGLTAFWERGEGTNVSVSSGITLPRGIPCCVGVAKDTAAKVVRFYLNGILVATTAYTFEPTGGSTDNMDIGLGDVGTANSTDQFLAGHVAWWDGVQLSGEDMARLARAAGLFGPPMTLLAVPDSIASASNVQTFTTPGADVWNKPTGGGATTIVLVGGGGGGGGGRKAAVSNTRAGGGGGGGGGMTVLTIPTSGLGSSVGVDVGAGGAGGAGATVDGGGGSSGSAGGTSAFGTFARATGGGNGVGGTSTTHAGGAGGIGLQGDGGAGGTGGTTTATAGTAAKYAGGGGGGGGGVTSANNLGVGQAGGGVTFTNPALSGGSAGGSAGTAGGAGESTGVLGVPGAGGGGGAGQGTVDLSAGAGGAGGLYGGGGGGGAGCINGAGVAGDGGAGGQGIVVVVTV